MKKRDSILKLLAASALLLATAACTKDETAGGDRLPEGEYPLEIAGITLGVESGQAQPWGAPQTRVSEIADGTGSVFDAGDRFAIQIDGEEEVGTYTVQDDNTVKAETPLYWNDRDRHTVNAWYPATDGALDLSDQSQRLAYLLNGTGTGRYPNPVTLTFTHALAKVRITPSDEILGEVKSLQLYTCTQCTHTQGTDASGTAEGWIEMKKCTYTENDVPITCWEANVVPGYEITKLMANNDGEERTLSAAITPVAGEFYNISLDKDKGYIIDENGTYIVYSEEGLRAWANVVKYGNSPGITLTADITLTPPADGGSNWNPIDTYLGTFDGGGHTISGLVIKGNSTRLGFFQFLKSATVKNLTLENVQITNDFSWDGWSYVGGLAGVIDYSTIENCFVSGSVIGNALGKWSKSCVGGVVGRIASGGTLSTVAGCGSSATVKGHNRAGGVAGELNLDDIVSSYATGSVTLESNTTENTYIGGLVGYCYDSFISGCYATGSVTGSGSGTIYVGGVLGTSLCGTLNACYHAQGKVSGPNGTTGGVLGQNIWDSKFGGGILNVCYWENNGQEKGIGTNEGGTVLEATRVDGTTVTWQNAVDAMNPKLDWLGTGWHYELKDGNSLPTLKKL